MGLLCKIGIHNNHKFKTDAPGVYLECKSCGLRRYVEKNDNKVGYSAKAYDINWVNGKNFLPRSNKELFQRPKRI